MAMRLANALGLGALRGGGAGLLAAPVLTWTSDTATATPTFNLDGPIVAGDTIEVQIQISGGDWSSLEQDKSHTLTSGESTANTSSLSFDPLSNATHGARARYQHGGVWSNWSNVEIKTISAGTYRIASTGNRRISSAGNYRKVA